MTDQQPTALRLADFLRDWLGNNVEPADLEAACVSAAAELRRLHEVNAAQESLFLREAAQMCLDIHNARGSAWDCWFALDKKARQ